MYQRETGKILVAKNEKAEILFDPALANRHGLITGATGTGKTITLKVLAEGFSGLGTSVFLADVKGDVGSLCEAGKIDENLQTRIDKLQLTDFSSRAFSTRFFDVYGKNGINIRTTISDFGALLLARVMDLSEVQTEVLSVVFKIAKDYNLPLKTIGDLRALLNFVSTNMEKLKNNYGGISELTMAALMRNVIHLESSGGELFFGEPAFEITDWLQTNEQGEGMINVLQAVTLIQNPLLYSTFLLWMLTKLYEVLPEVGDQDKPKIVFFFDEAHLLFRDASKVLLQKIEQVARLIRSKGVGVYFITQSPTDIPEIVLAQLGNKIQHALRAYTPKDQKMLKVVAESFRANPDFKTIEVLSELGTGEALISFLDKKGVPSVVERAWILPPQSLIGTVSEQTIREKVAADTLLQKYTTVNSNQNITATSTSTNGQPLSETEKFLQQKQKSQTKPNVFEKGAQKVITNTASTMGRELGKKIIKSLFR